MRPGFIKDMFIRLGAPVHWWRARSVRKAALALYMAHGPEAVAVLREQIGACARYSDRRRLYRLHDEIARHLPGHG